MEGVGGAHQEVTWQRYNGVRRSKFIAEDEPYSGELIKRERETEVEIDTRDRGRRFVKEKSKTEGMWTEITKDLVSEEAMKEMGYEYEETEFFYYVMTYLRYVSLLSAIDHLCSYPLFEMLTKHRRTSSNWSTFPQISRKVVANVFERYNGSGRLLEKGQESSWLSAGTRKGSSSVK